MSSHSLSDGGVDIIGEESLFAAISCCNAAKDAWMNPPNTILRATMRANQVMRILTMWLTPNRVLSLLL